MAELSEFESQSSKTPMKTPVAIIVGAALFPLLLWVINLLVPNEAIQEAKDEENAKDGGSQVDAGDMDDEI